MGLEHAAGMECAGFSDAEMGPNLADVAWYGSGDPSGPSPHASSHTVSPQGLTTRFFEFSSQNNHAFMHFPRPKAAM